MTSNDYDYIIVGQGLAGSVLSYLLQKEGKSVFVIDKINPNSSSRVAAGLVNPVTGRRVVKSWMADTLIPFADKFYGELEIELGSKFYHHIDVLEVVNSVKELNEWTSRMNTDEMSRYLSVDPPEKFYLDKISEFKKMIRINSSGWMDIPLFIELCRDRLKNSSALLEEYYDFNELKIEPNQITYRSICSKRIIFCEGYQSLTNDLWKWIPLVPAKGELLTIMCKDLPEDFILMSGMFLIPLGNHHFRAGSTYEWNFEHDQPTDGGKFKLLNQLNKILKISFEVIDHQAGIRPTVKDRRPLIGRHPDYKNVFLFNGMGTKGVVLIPYFADHFYKYLNGKTELMEEVNSNRFLS